MFTALAGFVFQLPPSKTTILRLAGMATNSVGLAILMATNLVVKGNVMAKVGLSRHPSRRGLQLRGRGAGRFFNSGRCTNFADGSSLFGNLQPPVCC